MRGSERLIRYAVGYAGIGLIWIAAACVFLVGPWLVSEYFGRDALLWYALLILSHFLFLHVGFRMGSGRWMRSDGS